MVSLWSSYRGLDVRADTKHLPLRTCQSLIGYLVTRGKLGGSIIYPVYYIPSQFSTRYEVSDERVSVAHSLGQAPSGPALTRSRLTRAKRLIFSVRANIYIYGHLTREK